MTLSRFHDFLGQIILPLTPLDSPCTPVSAHRPLWFLLVLTGFFDPVPLPHGPPIGNLSFAQFSRGTL